MDLDITDDQLKAWEGGELIQNVMPDLTVEEREFLISGNTAEDWNKMFPEGDD